jgi:Ca2+-binding RTX toxin-like protein
MTLQLDFNEPIQTPLNGFPRELIVGDFNGDGFEDVIVAQNGYYSYPYGFTDSTVALFLGDGTGNLTLSDSFTVDNYPADLKIADLNGDGFEDLVVVSNDYLINDSSNVSILLGDGSGNFSPSTNLTVADGAKDVAISDFNGDGFKDLAVTTREISYYYGYYGYKYYYYSGSNVSVLLGDGSGNFGSPTDFELPGTFPSDIGIGDFNGDGFQDLVTSDYSSSLSVLLGDGTGSFGAATQYSLSSFFVNPYAVAVADLNGDGFDDIVSANGDSYYSYYSYGGTVSVLLADGTGGFAPADTFIVGTDPEDVAIADFNGDGKLDIVTANESYFGGGISILLGDGTGNFDSAVNFFTGNTPNHVDVGDFDGDGLVDVVTTGYGGYYYYYGESLSVLLNSSKTLILGTGKGDIIAGTNKDEVIKGLIGNDDLSGKGGDDEIFGGGNNDTISGGNGNDLLDGGPGNDQLSGNAGDDTLFGGDGDDNLSGGSGNDFLSDEVGNNTLSGGVGDDTIYSGNGDDNLSGGSGNDFLSDYDYDSTGNNTLSGGVGDDTIYSGYGDDTIYGDSGNDFLSDSAGNNTLSGGVGDDTIYGGSGNDSIDGGNDIIYGGSGNDSINGFDGNDTLLGSTGNDTLIGSYGDDRMTGGSGADLFEFGYGSDTIVDFEDGTDKLQLSFGISFNDVFIEQNGSSTIVFDENQILATLVGVNATNVTIDDFVV